MLKVGGRRVETPSKIDIAQSWQSSLAAIMVTEIAQMCRGYVRGDRIQVSARARTSALKLRQSYDATLSHLKLRASKILQALLRIARTVRSTEHPCDGWSLAPYVRSTMQHLIATSSSAE